MHGWRILVVDDDQLILKFVTVNLEARGFQVFQATHGEQALDAFYKNPVDLILLDIMMPKMNGHEVCCRIRQQSTIPIIMLSGLDGPQDKAACLDSGADDYMTKPFSLRVLFARIEAVLRRTQSKLPSIDDLEKG
jgi:two-component system, OmpR family, KDP operon response regulator KdpE